MTKFTAEVAKSIYTATVSLGTSTAGGLPAAVLAGAIAGTGLLAGLMNSAAPGAIVLAGVVGGTGILAGDLTMLSSAAEVVREMISVGGDSWTDGGTSVLSRNSGASTVDSDRWDYQAAVEMGIPNYKTPNQASTSPTGIINVGYGGQSSGTVYKNAAAIIAADPGRADDIWTWWPGRNDVSKPGTDVWPQVTTGTYSATITANTTNGGLSLSGVSPVTLAWADLRVTGPGIQADTYITASAGQTTASLSKAATATATGVTLTVSGLGVEQFLALIPHDRKVVIQPYGGSSLTAGNADWSRWTKMRWHYRRNYRKYNLELLQTFMNRGVSDGSAAELLDVAAQSQISSLSYLAHPNHVAVPIIKTALVPLFLALQNRGVYVPAQTIPDIRCDMAAGETIEVYLRGWVNSISIQTDDPTLPGLFTISMKPGSHDIALLTRTSASPGDIPRILNLVVQATGVDILGAAKTATGPIRILPTVVGLSNTMPRGATLVRDPNPDSLGQLRRWPRLTALATPTTATALSLVMRVKPSEDGTNMNFMISSNNLIINRSSNNRMVITMKDSAGATVLAWSGTVSGTVLTQANGWQYIAFSIDLATPSVKCWYSKGSGDVDIGTGASVTTALNSGNGVLNTSSSIALLTSAPQGYSSFVGGFHMMWMDFRYIDFSDSAQRRKFWNTDGTPVDLGADGSAGLGSAPLLYLRGGPGDFVTGKNFGVGGDMAWNDQWLLGNDSDPLPLAA